MKNIPNFRKVQKDSLEPKSLILSIRIQSFILGCVVNKWNSYLVSTIKFLLYDWSCIFRHLHDILHFIFYSISVLSLYMGQHRDWTQCENWTFSWIFDYLKIENIQRSKNCSGVTFDLCVSRRGVKKLNPNDWLRIWENFFLFEYRFCRHHTRHISCKQWIRYPWRLERTVEPERSSNIWKIAL